MTDAVSDGAICSRGHDESDSHVLPSGKRVCRPCRQLRKKRKEDRRDRKWPFVETLPAETGYNLGHHRTKPGDEHSSGEGCHCLPDRIPHLDARPKWIAFPGRVPVCRDCGTDWQPVRRGECSACGSDAGPLEARALPPTGGES